MRSHLVLSLLCSALAVTSPGCDDGESDGDADIDGDSDSDVDIDGDSDTDSDSDSDSDGDEDDPCDVDRDSFRSEACGGTDCDDENPEINPGAYDDCCVAVDTNCDGVNGMDTDGDGFLVGDDCCTADTDCDDDNPSVNPSATEVCNGIDDNCSWEIDEGFGCVLGETRECESSCGTTGSEECVDPCEWSGTCTPPDEECNGEDDDCDGEIDNGFDCLPGDVGECTTECGSTGTRVCEGTCSWPTDCTPPAEECGNDEDDDCDGLTDPPLGVMGDVIDLADNAPSLDHHPPSIVWTGHEFGVAWCSVYSRHPEGLRTTYFFARLAADGTPLERRTLQVMRDDVYYDTGRYCSYRASLVWTGGEYGLVFVDSTREHPTYTSNWLRFTRITVRGGESTRGEIVNVTSFGEHDTLSASPSLVWNGTEYRVVWGSYNGDTGADGLLTQAIITSDGVAAEPSRIAVEGSWFLAGNGVSLVWNGTGYGLAYDARSAVHFMELPAEGAPESMPVAVSGDGASSRGYPSLVWTGSEYGVAWMDQRSGQPVVYFRRVSADGVPLGTGAPVCGDGCRVYADRVWGLSLAWDGESYGVAWSDFRDALTLGFRKISVEGNPLGADDILISWGSRPAIAWNGHLWGVVGEFESTDGAGFAAIGGCE